jgi:hypothetical protein
MSEFSQKGQNTEEGNKQVELKCPNNVQHILKPLYSSPYENGSGVMCDLCFEFIEDGAGTLFYHCNLCKPSADFCENCIKADFTGENNLSMIESVKISIKRNIEGIPFGPSESSKETRNFILDKVKEL